MTAQNEGSSTNAVKAKRRHEPEPVFFDVGEEEDNPMVGIPRDRMFTEIPEAKQGPDLPGNAQQPDVGDQLAMYKRGDE